MSSKRLTVALLKKIINEEKKKLSKQSEISSDTVEDAWSGGKNLVNQIDYIKKLGIQESKLRKKVEVISKVREILKRRLVKKI